MGDILSQSGMECLIGRGSPEARVMFIQDCPDDADIESGKQLSGHDCDVMLKSAMKRGITDVYLTSICKYGCKDNKASSKEAEDCKFILDAEVSAVDPDILVPLGNQALRYCIGHVGLTKSRGNASEEEVVGRTRIVLPMMNPKSVGTKPIYKDYILCDLDRLSELYKNGMTKVSGVGYRSLDTVSEVARELSRMADESRIISFDIETTGLDPFSDDSRVICISLTDRTHYGVVIPLGHPESPFSGDDLDIVSSLVRELLESDIPKVAHNGKFDIKWLLHRMRINVRNFSFDTMLAHYLCVSEERGTQGLKSQAWEYTDMGGYDNELDEVRSQLPEAQRYNYGNIPWSVLSKYAAGDVDVCLRLYEIYKPMINKNQQWSTIMSDILMPGSYALRDVETNGMHFEQGVSEAYQRSYSAEIARIQDRLDSFPEVIAIQRDKQALWEERQQIGLIPRKERTEEEQQKFVAYKKYQNFKFNWSSASQLRELLYDRLGLVTDVRTSKGDMSTNEEAMNDLAKQHEIPSLLLELRKVNTLNNMFIQKLPHMVDSNSIVHPTFNMTGTVTGRMASENPNAQQFPRKAENPLSFQYTNEPKALFGSRFGSDGCILNADYSALEMRIAGIISNDQTLLKALLSGADLHKSTASLVWGVPVDEVPKDMRTRAKAVNFGIIYGKSGITFARDLYYDPSGTDPKKTDDWDAAREEGLKLVDDYLDTFSGLKRWLSATKRFAHKHGYVETMFGRRRRLPDLGSKVSSLRSNAERQAINAPIQGTGSDFTLLSVIQINNWLNKSGKRSRMICTVHDSIVFDVSIPELPDVATYVKHTMEHVHEKYIDTPFPIRSDLELGPSYGATFDVELEDVQKLGSTDRFNSWVHENKLAKFRKEIHTLHSQGWGYQQLISWMGQHSRPMCELVDDVIAEYTSGDSHD